MDYKLEDINRITSEYNDLDNWMRSRLNTMFIEMGYINDIWRLEDYEIFDNSLHVLLYDCKYDLHETKAIDIPLSFVCDPFWKTKWRMMEEKRLAKEAKEAEKCKAEKEVQEYAEYLRLMEKFRRKEE